MALGYFARIGLVLAHLVRGALDPAGSLLEDFAKAGSRPGHFGRAGPFGAFERAARGLDQFAKPVPVRFAPALQARLGNVHLR